MSISDTSTPAEQPTQLTLDEIWKRRDELIQRGFKMPETTLIEAIPGTGKSYGGVKWAAQTGKPLTVLAPRHDLLDDDYTEWCEDFGLNDYRLPSFFRDCTSFEKNGKGEYEPVNATAGELRREYSHGIGGKYLHQSHSDLPCQKDGECPFMAKQEFEPSDYDVLLGTYRHAKSSEAIENRYVVFDEFPGNDFLMTFKDGVAPVVTAYLEGNEEQLPFKDYLDFVERKGNSEAQEYIKEWKGSHRFPQDYKHARKSPNPSAHSFAPLATRALIEKERLDNNWEYADLGDGCVAVRNPKEDEWTFLRPPDLSDAESVLAFDGTPNMDLWEVSLGEQIERLSLLDVDERVRCLQGVLDYQFVQTTEKWKAIQSGEGAAPPKDLAVIEGIAHKEGQTPALISSQKAIRQYEPKGLAEITETVEHYNNLKGMNKFGPERLGIVLGNPHPGDDEIEKWAALAGESAERRVVNGQKTTGKETDYGSFGNKVMHTLVHDEVFQAAMRFGREKENGEQGATVFIHTAAIPAWLPVEKQIIDEDVQSWLTEKNGMKDTIDAIRSLDGWKDTVWKSTELYDHVSTSNRNVRNRLDDLVEAGYISFEGKWGHGTPKHYTNICLEDAGCFGHVEWP